MGLGERIKSWFSRDTDDDTGQGRIFVDDSGSLSLRWDAPNGEGTTPLHYTSMMGIPAFRCGVQIIAQSVAAVDLVVTLDGDEDEEHPVARIWNDAPNPYMTPYTWKELVLSQLLSYGNFFAFIERAGVGGMPRALHPLNADKYSATADGFDVFFSPSPNLVARGNPTDRRYERDEVFYVPSLGYDGMRGYSPLQLHEQTLKQTLATYDYGRLYFTRGGKPEGFLTTDDDVPQSVSETISEIFDEELKARKTPVLSHGLAYESVMRNPNEAQFLETRQSNVVEIARILNIPPAMLHDLTHGTYSNVAQQTTTFVDMTIRPWTRRLESAIRRQLLMLPGETETAYDCRFNLTPLYSSDRKTRMESYALGLEYGVYTIDEVREMEGLPSLGDFEDMYVPDEDDMTTEDAETDDADSTE